MLDGLVAMGIVPHIHQLHLTYLVYDEAVVTIVKDGREREDAIELLSKGFVTSHQVNESLDIVED